MIRFTKRGRAGKFNNQRVTIDGQTFASKREAKRYTELMLLQKIGKIYDVQTQPRFPIVVEGKLICTYVGDFAYEMDGTRIVEDVKSAPTKTPVYRLKKKLMRAVHGIDISEVE